MAENQQKALAGTSPEKFGDFGLASELLKALDDLGYSSPTPIQSRAIPVILEGKDVMGAAQTGTGKTAGYSLPVLQSLLYHANTSMSPARHPVRALVLVPTRELADQVYEDIRKYAKYTRLRAAVVFGGVDISTQTGIPRAGTEILIATPGRLLDHIQQKNVNLGQTHILVLDEADRMLDMGFYDDIMQVHKQLPPYCQTIMFSATMPPKIRTLAKTILKDPEEVKIAISRPPESIMQTAYICYDPQKLKILQDLFTQSRPQRVIIFSSSKMKVKELASTLKRLKFNVAAMHSDLEQSQREEVMKEFKSGHIDILVATDVVARGIDINDIKLVVNFDIPHDPEDYVHRIGRTARGTNGEGLAITFVSIDEQAQFKRIEDFLEKEVYKIPVSPEFGEVPLYEPEKYGMNKRGRGRPRKSEDKGSSSSPQKRNMGHRGRPKKAQ